MGQTEVHFLEDITAGGFQLFLFIPLGHFDCLLHSSSRAQRGGLGSLCFPGIVIDKDLVHARGGHLVLFPHVV